MFVKAFSKRTLFAACLGAFLCGPTRAESDHADTMIVGSIKFETKLGNGTWPCSFAPFAPDKPCSEQEEGRGYRYKQYEAKWTYNEYYLNGSGGHGWIDVSTFILNDNACLGSVSTTSHYQSTSPSSSSSQEAESNVQMPPPPELSGLRISKTRATGAWSAVQTPSPTIGETWSEIHSLSNPVGITLTNPTDIVPGVGVAYKWPDGRYQATTVIGRTCPCPGKYEAILFYKEYPLDGSAPLEEPQEQQLPPEDVDVTDDDLPDGKEIKLPLPNTECSRTVFVRMELRPKKEKCVSCQGGGGGGSDGGGSAGGAYGPGGGRDWRDVSRTSLGRDYAGHSQGEVRVTTSKPTSDSYSPRGLTFVPGDADILPEIVRASDHSIRQVHGKEALVDVTPVFSGTATVGYKVAFYPPPAESETPDPVTGLYSIAPEAVPLSTVRYEDPDAGQSASGTRLRVTREVAGASPKISEYAGIPNGLSLIQGGGLVRTVRTTTRSGLDSTEREESFSPATATVPDHVSWTITRDFPFGQRVIEESRGTGSARAWTTFAYDENSSSSTYGMLLSKVSSNGAWERFEYNPQRKLAATVSPLGDAGPTTLDTAQLRREEKIRTDVAASVYGSGLLTTTIEYLGGVEVRRSHRFERTETPVVNVNGAQYLTEHEISVQAKAPGPNVAWDDLGNQFGHRYTILVGPDEGSPALEVAADGSVVLFRYSGSGIGGTVRRQTERWAGIPDTPVTPTTTPTDVIAGTRTKTVTTADRLMLSEETRDAATNHLIASKTYDNHDAFGRPQLVVHIDGSEETREYSPCCGQLTKVKHRGITTTWGYDALGRREWEKVEVGSGASLQTLSHNSYTYDSQGRMLTRTRVPTAGPSQLIERNVYDDAGTLLSTATPGSLTTDPTLTRVTTYGSSYDATTGRTTKTVTRPDGATEVTIERRSGDVYSRTGTGAFPVRYEYGTATLSDAAGWDISTSTPVPYTKEIKLSAAGADTAETTTTYSDFLGRPIKTVYGDGAASRSFYNAKGQLVRQTDPDGVQTLYTYNELGERLLTVLDYNRNGTNSIPGIDLGGTDRITRTTTVVGTRDTIPVRRTTGEAWLTDGVDSATELLMTEVSLDGLQTWQTSYGQLTHTLIAHDATTGTRTETTTHPDLTQTIRTYQADRLKSETRKDTSGTAVAETLYGYDAHGRVQVVSNLQAPGSALPAPDSSLATTYTYYADDQVASMRTPDPDLTRSGTGYDAQLTSYHYDAAGRVDLVTHPDHTETKPSQTNTSYWPTGRVKRTWGTRGYPSEYAYDAQGRVKTLTTWKDFAGSAGAALTTWNYHPQRGWLSSKVYAGGAPGPSYTYWPSGRLKTRVWARGITTTYTYNNAGDLWTVVYSGDAAPTVTTVYDRLGRQKTITDAAGTLTRTYDRGLLDDESYVGGLLAGRTLTRALETNTGAVTVARPGTLGATALNALTYGYDTAGRLQTITEASGSVATLGYKPLVGALQSITTATAGTTRLATNRVIDQLGRVASVDFDNPAPSLLASRAYTYNGANQRVQVEHEDTRRWAYGYDALGQVNLAEKRQSNNSVLPGYAYAFDYDDIGNRETATANGRVSNYSSDALNRYLARGTPLWADVRGKALDTASVLVNDELATRTGEDFYLAVPVSGLKENTLKIQVARPSPEQAVTETRSLLVPTVPENFVYDADGNLTQDGLWNYQWDGENRLKAQELRSDVATATWRRIQYAYDGQGRRIQKLVTTAPSPGGTPTTTSDTRFLYDGWNLVAEYSYSGATFTLVRSHAWGLDLSGSAQGAGGVGGLLWTKVAATAKTYAAGSDANGNVVVYVDCADGSVAGRREYGAFGEAVLTTGIAGSLPFGFSTKFEEKETGLYYYGFRYYSPSTSRWLGRDPTEEDGGLNLYGIIYNDPVNYTDYLGLKCCELGQILIVNMRYSWSHYGEPYNLDEILKNGLSVAKSLEDAADYLGLASGKKGIGNLAKAVGKAAGTKAGEAADEAGGTEPGGTAAAGAILSNLRNAMRNRNELAKRAKHYYTIVEYKKCERNWIFWRRWGDEVTSDVRRIESGGDFLPYVFLNTGLTESILRDGYNSHLDDLENRFGSGNVVYQE
jgi:RHS repeat-associated protein